MTESQTPSPTRTSRSFFCLVGMQMLNAFNDNLAKFILIPLGVALAAEGLAMKGTEYVLGLLMVLPFIIFAPVAGWLGDRFAKSQVIRWSAWLQLAVLLLMAVALAIQSLALSLVAFFLLATQSALLSPSKMGIVKELVGSRRLGFANGVMEGTVILAILGGQILGGVSFDLWGLQAGRDDWEAALVPVLWVLIGAGLSLMMAHAIRPTEPRRATPFSASLWLSHFKDLAELRKDRPLWRAAMGIAFFWGFGGFLQLLVIQIASETTGGRAGMGLETALLWVPVVVGITLGSLLASWVSRRRNELGLVVVGGTLMAFSMLMLVIWPRSELLLGLAGAGGALFLVPLNAYLQDRAPEGQRGMVISASNLCINLAGLLAVGLQFGLREVGLPAWAQYLFLAVACGVATVYVMRLLPQDFARLLVLGLVRSIYKVRVSGEEKVPAQGGVLLVANHVSYVDALVLSAAFPRKIRFMMFADCFEHRWVGKFARLFDTIPVSRTRAKEGIRAAAEALQEGAVVCIFPEGQLSRTGGLGKLQRGYQMIAKKAGVPVLPAYLDGLWGSLFSFSGGRFFRKPVIQVRYGVEVALGDPMAVKEDLAAVFRQLSTVTLTKREKRFPRASAERSLRLNALQLAQVNVGWKGACVLIEVEAGSDIAMILGELWPQAIHAEARVVEPGKQDRQLLDEVEQGSVDVAILTTGAARDELITKLREKEVGVWTFDGEGGADLLHIVDERVVSVSMPDPSYDPGSQDPQPGRKEGTLGKLLPGFGWSESGVTGEALKRPVLEGVSLDEDSFLHP